jgi:hypothetical protein
MIKICYVIQTGVHTGLIHTRDYIQAAGIWCEKGKMQDSDSFFDILFRKLPKTSWFPNNMNL